LPHGRNTRAALAKSASRAEHRAANGELAMRLIGMLDSPYVRRVAVSLNVLGMAFELDQVSVFRHFDRFAAINPLVKAPTLVSDDGTVLMDSSLILEHIAHIAPKSLMPAERGAHQMALRQIGLALAACEKSVSVVYERNLRPVEKQHQPWLDRVRGQLLAAYGALEKDVSPDWFTGEDLMQPQISVAVAWRFTSMWCPNWLRRRTSPDCRSCRGGPRRCRRSRRQITSDEGAAVLVRRRMRATRCRLAVRRGESCL
jgi:glutathione S-transferase